MIVEHKNIIIERYLPMIKDKKKLTLLAAMVAIAAWLITTIVLYWIFIQMNPQPPLPPQPSETLPTKASSNGVRLQPPDSSSPKLEPDEEKPIIKPTLIDSDNKENSTENPIENLKEVPKNEKDLKDEKDLNDSEQNLVAEPDELEKDSEKNSEKSENNQQQPPKNVSKPKTVSIQIPKSPEPENPSPSSWVTIDEKIIMVETTISKIIDVAKNNLPTNVSQLENDELENQKWSTVGEQLIKVEEQINKSVKELYKKNKKQ